VVLARKFAIRCAAVCGVLAAAGCAGAVTTAAGERLTLTSPEFRAYVERIFREQNQVATQLAFAIEDREAGAAAASLEAAEQSLLTACAGLNELATARRDEQDLGVLQQAQAARQAPLCEDAIGTAREALENVGT
jgi:hypothetical protein